MGALHGSGNFKHKYVDEIVRDWNSQLCMLSTTAESKLQAAYSAFVNDFKNQLSFILRTISDTTDLLVPIEDAILNRFIKAITGSRICNKEERKLLFLPTRHGELAIAFFHKQAEVKYNNSQRITTEPTILTNRQHT